MVCRSHILIKFMPMPTVLFAAAWIEVNIVPINPINSLAVHFQCDAPTNHKRPADRNVQFECDSDFIIEIVFNSVLKILIEFSMSFVQETFNLIEAYVEILDRANDLRNEKEIIHTGGGTSYAVLSPCSKVFHLTFCLNLGTLLTSAPHGHEDSGPDWHRGFSYSLDYILAVK